MHIMIITLLSLPTFGLRYLSTATTIKAATSTSGSFHLVLDANRILFVIRASYKPLVFNVYLSVCLQAFSFTLVCPRL